MKKWLVYLLGIITGVILTFAFAFMLICLTILVSLDLKCLKNPEITWSIHNLRFFKWLNLDVLWLMPDDSFGAIVFIIPNENQQFYDEQKIVLKKTNVHNVSERISIVPKWK